MSRATRQQRLDELKHSLWRKNYRGVATCSGCTTHGCSGSARGGGLCPDCVELELAELVGPLIAKGYHQMIKNVRFAENEMDEVVHQ